MALLLIALASVSLADSAYGYASTGYRGGDRMGGYAASREAVVISKSVTIRSKAGYNGSSLGSASNGERLEVLDDSDATWLQVRYAGKKKDIEGWVLRSYVVMQPLTITLRRSNTPAYCAPVRSSKLVGSLSAYTTMDVIGTYDNFYIVSLRQAAAFVSMDADLWTSTEIEQMFASGSGEAVTVKKAKTRSGPGKDWPEGETLAAGTSLQISWPENGWVPALYDGKLVYVEQDALEIARRVSGISGSSRQPRVTEAPAGQTITLPRTGGVTLTYWAVEEEDSQAVSQGALSLTQATELAVQELTRKYGLKRRNLMGYEIHYSFRRSGYYAYGVSNPFWSILFWAGDEEGVLWDVDVDAKTGAILYSAGPDDGNG